MAPNAIKRASFFVALLVGVWGTNANAVCFDKNGVSADPSKAPVIPWATEFREASVILTGTVVAEKNIPDPKEPDFGLAALQAEGRGAPEGKTGVFGSGV